MIYRFIGLCHKITEICSINRKHRSNVTLTDSPGRCFYGLSFLSLRSGATVFTSNTHLAEWEQNPRVGWCNWFSRSTHQTTFLPSCHSLLCSSDNLMSLRALPTERKSFIIISILKSCDNKRRRDANFVSLPHSCAVHFHVLHFANLRHFNTLSFALFTRISFWLLSEHFSGEIGIIFL